MANLPGGTAPAPPGNTVIGPASPTTTLSTGCGTTPCVITLGHEPIDMTIDASVNDLYVADDGDGVTVVSPTAGPTSGGTKITITGTGFTTGAISATNVKVVSSTEITGTTGRGGKVGTWATFVHTSDGTSWGGPAHPEPQIAQSAPRDGAVRQDRVGDPESVEQ
jgi:IPT/TIG domain